MTKKDYIKIAQVIRTNVEYCRRYDEPVGRYHDLTSVAIDLADRVFAPGNPRFDRARFLKACGLEGVADE
jgi:hypothetical protein